MIYAYSHSLSLHAALPSSLQSLVLGLGAWLVLQNHVSPGVMIAGSILMGPVPSPIDQVIAAWRQWSGTRLAWKRSEEHTSELQSLMRISYAVFCLKKKKRLK